MVKFQYAGWSYTYPLKNDGLKVSWDDDIPNWMESHKIHVPNHQQVVQIIPLNSIISIPPNDFFPWKTSQKKNPWRFYKNK